MQKEVCGHLSYNVSALCTGVCKAGSENHRILKTLNVSEIKDEHTAADELIFYQTENRKHFPGTFTLNGERLHISTLKDTWDMNVYKSRWKRVRVW